MSRLISAADFIFGASQANDDSASTVSPQCSRGGPDSDTRSTEKRKTSAKIRALDRERANERVNTPGGNHVTAVEIGILIGRDKNCGRSRIHVTVETRSSTSTFRFKCRSLVRPRDFRLFLARIKSRRCFPYGRFALTLRFFFYLFIFFLFFFFWVVMRRKYERMIRVGGLSQPRLNFTADPLFCSDVTRVDS